MLRKSADLQQNNRNNSVLQQAATTEIANSNQEMGNGRRARMLLLKLKPCEKINNVQVLRKTIRLNDQWRITTRECEAKWNSNAQVSC